jgi:hypothetical protein
MTSVAIAVIAKAANQGVIASPSTSSRGPNPGTPKSMLHRSRRSWMTPTSATAAFTTPSAYAARSAPDRH